MYRYCRECKTELEEDEQATGLCRAHISEAADWHRFDLLREEGHPTHAAKLMAGLADPPDPDEETDTPRLPGIESLKRRAKKLKKTTNGMTHTQALDKIAQQHGHTHWLHLSQNHPDNR